MLKPYKIKGAALLSALFITALIAIAATNMSSRLELISYQTSLIFDSSQLALASSTVSFWAMHELSDKKNHFLHKTNNAKLLDYPYKLISYPGIKISGALYDLQAGLNLNNLQDKRFQQIFVKLLEKLNIASNELQSKQIIQAINSWISPFKATQDNDLQNYYLKQTTPYLQSHQFMQDLSEFRLIKGVSATTYQKLEPYLTVLPEITAININTASKTILSCLGNGLDDTQVDEILAVRNKTGTIDLKDLNPLLQKLNISSNDVTTTSKYFLSIAKVSTTDLTRLYYTVIQRSQNPTEKITIKIISESSTTI